MDHLNRYFIWQVELPGYQHSAAYADLCKALNQAFANLGGSCPIIRGLEIQYRSTALDRTPIVIGAHLLTHQGGAPIPPDAVIFNIEQIGAENGMGSDARYLKLLDKHPTIDYSLNNQTVLLRNGIDAVVLPVRPEPSAVWRQPKDVGTPCDVLLYGSLNPRRQRVIDQMRAAGLEVQHLFGVYGVERDKAIAAARVVLNLHFYETNIFESVRVSHAVALGEVVVSEGELKDRDCRAWQGAVCFADYDQLTESCVDLCLDENWYQLIQARAALMPTQTDALRQFLQEHGTALIRE